MSFKQVVMALAGWITILLGIGIFMLIPAAVMWAIGFPVPAWAVYLAIVHGAMTLVIEIWRGKA